MQESYVCKFGGSSVATADQIRKVEDIIRSDERRRFVVVSAPGKSEDQPYKMTDLLYNLFHLSNPETQITSDYETIGMTGTHILQEINRIYSNIARGLKLDDLLVEQLIDELHQSLQKISFTPEEVVSRGENFNARLIAKYLGARFVDAADVISISGTPKDGDNQRTMENFAAYKDSDDLIVFPGFYGRDTATRIVTLPRGGSDLTGSLAAAGIGASLYENFTDTPGIYCVDPRLFPEEERIFIPLIDEANFRETRELTYRGFEVLNDETMGPVMKRGIPINIKDTNNPSAQGTLISTSHNLTPGIRGIAATNGFKALYIYKYLMNKQVGFGRDVLNVLAGKEINYQHMPSSVDSLSVIVKQEDIEGREDEIIDEIREELNLGDLEEVKFLDDKLALIAVVGEGMQHQIGMAAKVTQSLASHNVNIEIMDQGGTEITMLFGVKHTDMETAVRGLYYDLLKPKGN